MSLRTGVFLFPLAVSLAAQSVDVQGQLTGAATAGPLFIDLRSLDRRSPGDRADVRFDGSFEFLRIPSGTYELTVTTPHGTVLQSDLVTLGEQTRTLSVKLPAPPPRPKGLISIRRLTHRPPRPARKEFERAADALRRDRSDVALAHLAKAVEIDPNYAEAHNNLAVRYFLNGDLDLARRHFDRALEIDPSLAEVHANLSLMALGTGDTKAAEAHARRSIAFGGDMVKCDYLLGLSLARQNRREEAIPLLERASERYPHAARVLDELKGKANGR